MKSLITNAFKRDAIPWKSIYGPAPPISGKKHLKSHRSFHQTNDFLHFFLSLNMQQHRLPTLLSYDYLIIFYCNLPDLLIFSSFLGHSSAFFFFFSPQPPHVDIHFWILRSPPPASLSLSKCFSIDHDSLGFYSSLHERALKFLHSRLRFGVTLKKKIFFCCF